MDPIVALTTLKALDGLALRSTVAARNIANAQTAGYRPMKVSFEAALAQAAARGPEAVADLQPVIEAAETDGQGVRLDQELASASSAALRYGALVDVLSRRLQLTSMAVTGGR